MCVQGYKCINGFVAAQAPLESTIEAFWRMVWEIRCQTIVLLCDVKKEVTTPCSTQYTVGMPIVNTYHECTCIIKN